MSYPEFFGNIPEITLIDPLANLLGAAEKGQMSYAYLDAVKLAGHSCPTVAGAWLMCVSALQHLYPDSMPMRGGIKIAMREAATEGVTGVFANVFSLITGAAAEGGFKGMAGKFKRAQLLEFGCTQDQLARFTRLDTGASIGVDYDASVVPPAPEMKALMQTMVSGQAQPEDMANFGRVWQARVEKIMTTPELWPQMVKLS